MNVPVGERFDAGWLALREPADAAARAPGLVTLLRAYLAASRSPASRRREARHREGSAPVLCVLDLGSGTGSTVRWLAPQFDGPQRWVLLDHDPELLACAVARCTGLRDATGGEVEIRTRTADVTDLSTEDLAGTALVTASALLDLLTGPEVDALAGRCAAARCAALLTLSVVGRVVLEPPDPLDRVVAAAFDAHQRRTARNRPLLGPDAVGVAVDAFERGGFAVQTAASPWRLGPGSADLMRSWLDGWLAAAAAQQPALAAELVGYRERREGEIADGRLRVEVHHFDLLALPGH